MHPHAVCLHASSCDSQLAAKDAELRELQRMFEQLKADFKYNLGLLEERDAELDRFDTDHALLSATLADKERILAELQKLHADATSGQFYGPERIVLVATHFPDHECAELRIERARYSESEFLHQTKRTELQRQLEDERLAHAEALLKHREESEGAKRALQVSGAGFAVSVGSGGKGRGRGSGNCDPTLLEKLYSSDALPTPHNSCCCAPPRSASWPRRRRRSSSSAGRWRPASRCRRSSSRRGISRRPRAPRTRRPSRGSWPRRWVTDRTTHN